MGQGRGRKERLASFLRIHFLDWGKKVVTRVLGIDCTPALLLFLGVCRLPSSSCRQAHRESPTLRRLQVSVH